MLNTHRTSKGRSLIVALRMTACSLLSLLGVLLPSQATWSDSRERVTIGAILPLSGFAQAYGNEARMALEHALSDAKPVRFSYSILFEDDRATSAGATAAAQKLLSVDRADVLFSNWSYGGLAVASAVKGRSTNNFAFAWDPTVVSISENSFITAPPPDLLAAYIVKKLKSEGKSRVILVQMEESGSNYANETLERAAAAESVIILKRFVIDATDLGAMKTTATQIKKLQPEYLVTNLTLPQYLELFKNLKLLQVDIPVASIGQTPETPEFAAAHPSRWWSVDYSADQNSIDAIRARTGLKDLSGYAAYYDALRAVIQIYESAPAGDTPTPEWLREKLATYASSGTYLGDMSFKNRIRQSGNVSFVDQAKKYKG